MQDKLKLVLIVSTFVVEAIGFFVVTAVHLGAAVDVPGWVQPRVSAAAVSAFCGLALVGAAFAAMGRRRVAWEIGIGAQIMAVVGMLVIDKVLAVGDVSPIYRIGMAVAGVIGILLMTSTAKSALGREGRPGTRDRR